VDINQNAKRIVDLTTDEEQREAKRIADLASGDRSPLMDMLDVEPAEPAEQASSGTPPETYFYRTSTSSDRAIIHSKACDFAAPVPEGPGFPTVEAALQHAFENPQVDGVTECPICLPRN